VRKQIEDDMQVIEEAAKTNKTGWFKRTRWLPFLKGRNRAHLGYVARLPDRSEVKLRTAADLTEKSIEQSVKGLATLLRETRRWLRSAKQAEADQRPLARLQNPESQATYAGYIIRFVCFYLRIIADEESRVDEFLSQGSQLVDSSDEESSEDSGTESEYDDSDNDNNAGSTDNDSIAPPRRLRKKTQVDKMKDARELFTWKGDQKALAMQLWLMLDDSDATAQMSALLDSLTSFILTDYGNDNLPVYIVPGDTIVINFFTLLHRDPSILDPILKLSGQSVGPMCVQLGSFFPLAAERDTVQRSNWHYSGSRTLLYVYSLRIAISRMKMK
jgi:hypothetical protein